MAKKEEAVASVNVRLFCVLSGHPDNPGPGDVVALDADQAAQLIDIGVAEAYIAPPEGDGEAQE